MSIVAFVTVPCRGRCIISVPVLPAPRFVVFPPPRGKEIEEDGMGWDEDRDGGLRKKDEMFLCL